MGTVQGVVSERAAPDARAFGASLRLRGITRRYAGTTVLQPTDLDVEDGEFVTLLGPSGCGKTTLLRIVAGLTDPSDGQLWLGGQDVTAAPPERRNVNLVFQSYALFPHLDVRDNVAYGLRASGVAPGERRQRVQEAVHAMGLGELASRRVGQLSGGQAQRVALARALVNRPGALLLDEPLSALDPQLRKQMQAELRRIHQTFRTTFLYVTHDQDEALSMSDRIVVMNGGRVEQIGRAEEIYGEPRTAFVARFVGDGSFLPARVAHVDGAHAIVALTHGGARLQVRNRCEGAAAGDEVTIVVRPEHVALGESDSGIAGVVGDIWYGGDSYHACVDLAADDAAPAEVHLRLPAAAGSRAPLGPGDRVGLTIADGAPVAVRPEAR